MQQRMADLPLRQRTLLARRGTVKLSVAWTASTSPVPLIPVLCGLYYLSAESGELASHNEAGGVALVCELCSGRHIND